MYPYSVLTVLLLAWINRAYCSKHTVKSCICHYSTLGAMLFSLTPFWKSPIYSFYVQPLFPLAVCSYDLLIYHDTQINRMLQTPSVLRYMIDPAGWNMIHWLGVCCQFILHPSFVDPDTVLTNNTWGYYCNIICVGNAPWLLRQLNTENTVVFQSSSI